MIGVGNAFWAKDPDVRAALLSNLQRLQDGLSGTIGGD